jgi:hypothetical protein
LLVERTLLLPNADQIYQQAEQSLRDEVEGGGTLPELH